MNSFRELPLIIQKQPKDGGASYYELQKEGVDYLREISNRRLRIILNITSDFEILPFCDNFMGNGLTKSNPLENSRDWISSLSIYNTREEMSDGRALVMMNARYFSKEPNADYLLLGYLMSSLMILHENGGLNIANKGTNKQPMVKHLSLLSERLQNTDLSEINAQIRFEKKPYFLYIMHGVKGQQNSAKQLFGQFFKGIDRNDSEEYKKAAEVLIDYFPNRTAFYLNSCQQKDSIRKIRSNFVEKIVGRKIFNFEATGKSIEMLCIEMCQHFNSPNHSSLDMANLYKRVVLQQKQRVLTEGIQIYIRSLSQSLNTAIFPVEIEDLYQIKDQINRQTAEFIRDMAVNCMTLSQYLKVRDQINRKTAQRWQDAVHSNKRASRDLNTNLVNEFSKNDWSEDTEVETMCDEIIQKVHNFVYQSIGSTSKTSMAQLTQILVENMSQKFKRKMKNKEDIQEYLEIQNLEYRDKLKSLEESLQICENRLEMQFDRMGMSVRQSIYEQDEQWILYQKEVQELKSQIKQLEEMYQLKLLQMDEVYDQIERFSSMIDESKIKKNFTNMSNEINSSVRDFLKGIDKLEQFKKSYSKQFGKKKQEWQKQVKKYTSTIDQLKSLNAKLEKNIQQLTLNLKLSHQTVNIYESITKKSKEQIQSDIETQTSLTIRLAEQESKILLYQKSLQLIGQHLKEGTKDSLIKFAKINADSNLKRLLSTIIQCQ